MELLAPAGSWNGFLAAVENGADAVYLGAQSFSARQYAQNFDDRQIEEAVQYAHLRNRRVYAAVNTLIDNTEFNEALDLIWRLYHLNIDAIIMQDLGLIKAVRNIMPSLRIHASTQMTVNNSLGARLLNEQGLKRIVLARELSLDEIKTIHQEENNIELEVFVHGAMCYSYSGQCLFSSMVGGRSGNRGRCAQPCRLAYDLYTAKSDSRMKTPGNYLLSPSDLCLIEYLPQLKSTGINSLKIEGRMKRPEYVAVVTKAYREAIDLLNSDLDYTSPKGAKKELLKIFNRNFSSGHFILNKKDFLSTRKPNNRGVYTGRVVRQDQDLVTWIKLSDTLNLGDGLEVWVKKGRGPAFIVKEMQIAGEYVRKAQKGDVISLKLDSRVSPNDRVFKTHDEILMSRAANTIKNNKDHKIAVDVTASVKEGQKLKLVFIDEKGNTVEVFTRSYAQPADKYPLDEAAVRAKIDRLGNTPFNLRSFSLLVDKELMIPFSEINDARRRACEELIKLNLGNNSYPRIKKEEYREKKQKYLSTKNKTSMKTMPFLSIIVSGIDEAHEAILAGSNRVYLSLEGIKSNKINLKELKDLLSLADSHNCELIPALPRIQKPGEIEDWDDLYSTGCGCIMVGNLGALEWSLDKKINARVDYSLNIFNQYTMNYLLDMGAEGVCLSPELNFIQLENFKNLNKAEILVHGEIILMVSDFCMLSSVLGNEEKMCPGYCRKDSYYIKDQKGYKFPVETDNYCRFYVFNSRTLCMIENIERILLMGPESIRIEARRYNKNQVAKTVKIYSEVLNKVINREKPDLTAFKEELQTVSLSPFTKGHYFRGVL